MHFIAEALNLIPELNDKQLDRVSEFMSNFSLLMIASLVLPSFVGVDKLNLGELLSGLVLTIVFLLGSLFVLRTTHE
ncbi:hypothetical protein HYU93_03335 [Candidatus Daviesbacteria bacterium]|nr:hypothetical protein [Candidatus Daviesbacteria bacterium]